MNHTTSPESQSMPTSVEHQNTTINPEQFATMIKEMQTSTDPEVQDLYKRFIQDTKQEKASTVASEQQLKKITTDNLYSVQNVDKNDKLKKLYRNNKLPAYKGSKDAPTRQAVENVVNSLPEPFNTHVSDFIKKNDVEWLQKYLNAYNENRRQNGLSFRDGFPIKEDNMFGPETYRAIKMLLILETSNMSDIERIRQKRTAEGDDL